MLWPTHSCTQFQRINSLHVILDLNWFNTVSPTSDTVMAGNLYVDITYSQRTWFSIMCLWWPMSTPPASSWEYNSHIGPQVPSVSYYMVCTLPSQPPLEQDLFSLVGIYWTPRDGHGVYVVLRWWIVIKKTSSLRTSLAKGSHWDSTWASKRVYVRRTKQITAESHFHLPE